MSKRIRVVLAISDLSGGGAEREMANLLAHMSREHFDIHLCLWRPFFAYRPPHDVRVHVLEKTRPWHVFRTLRRTQRLIDELKPNVVFSQLHYLNIVTGTALTRCRHRPGWVFRLTNDPCVEMKGPFATWARRVLPRADCATGCCQGVSRAMVDYLRLDPARVRTLINVVDTAAIERLAREPSPLRKDPHTFTVVHAGRFHKQKNQAMLLDAFARFRGRSAELWMLGQGPLEEDLRTRARELGIEAQVRWLGFQKNPYPLFREADCFALSSNNEGLPNTIIESLLCGTPVVATRCPYGPDELIDHGATGLLTPVGDASAFGDALEHMAAEREARNAMASTGREQARERFDTAKVCRQYEQLFEEMAR